MATAEANGIVLPEPEYVNRGGGFVPDDGNKQHFPDFIRVLEDFKKGGAEAA